MILKCLIVFLFLPNLRNSSALLLFVSASPYMMPFLLISSATATILTTALSFFDDRADEQPCVNFLFPDHQSSLISVHELAAVSPPVLGVEAGLRVNCKFKLKHPADNYLISLTWPRLSCPENIAQQD